MDIKANLLPYLIVWLAVIIVVVWKMWTGRHRGAGLVLAYIFQLWLLHWVAALIHVLPWSFLPGSELVASGFGEATWGLIAFSVGCLLLAPMISDKALARQAHRWEPPDPSLPWAYVFSGIVSFVVLTPTIGRLPSFGALTAVGTQLFIVGVCLGCWNAWIHGRKTEHAKWILASLPLPAVTTIVMGFLGFGAIAFFMVLIFVAHFFRPRWILVVSSLLVGYLGLSLFVNYMMARGAYRQKLLQGASYSERIEVLMESLETAKWFDPYDPSHLEPIDERLNQNSLTGAAVVHLGLNGDFAKGETIWMGVLAMVPRMVWPEKPVFAGSMGLASRFTGMQFAEGTSVGMGPVLELYGNFGRWGVLVGFLVLGAVVGAIDHAAGFHLGIGNWHSFGLWYLVGMAFLQLGGSFVEVGGSAVAAVVVGHLTRWTFYRYRKGYHANFVPQVHPQH